MSERAEKYEASNVSNALMDRIGPSDYNGSGSLKSGGGGGGMDELNSRLSKVEAHMEHAREDLASIKNENKDTNVKLATLTEKLNHLPSKGFVVTSTIIALAVISALVTFQNQIQTFMGSAPMPPG